MSKFEDAFDNIGGGSGNGEGAEAKALRAEQNEAKVDAFGTADKARSRVGIISGIIDLGIQALDDAKVKWEGTPEQELEETSKENSRTYFEDGFDEKNKPCRFKRWPQKEQPAIAITVDFPQHTFDFGGEIGVKPTRFLLNGEFVPKGKKPWEVVVGRTYDLKETTKDFDPEWSLAKNSLPYKLAVATDIITTEQPFSKKQIGKLIGKAALFEVRIYLKDGYLQESIKFAGSVPEGLAIPEIDEDILYFINLTKENELVHVKQLRTSVKNTIKRSSSYEGSKLQEQYDEILFPPYKGSTGDTDDGTSEAGTSQETKPAAKAPAKSKPAAKVAPKEAPTPVEDYNPDEELPF